MWRGFWFGRSSYLLEAKRKDTGSELLSFSRITVPKLLGAQRRLLSD